MKVPPHWDRLLALLPQRFHAPLDQGDSGVVFRALCALMDEQDQRINALLKAVTDDGVYGPGNSGNEEIEG